MTLPRNGENAVVEKAQAKWSPTDLVLGESQRFPVFYCLFVALFTPWKDSGSEKMRNRVKPGKSLEITQEDLENQLLHWLAF